MSAVLIFGATRNTGYHLARLLRSGGRAVHAMLRPEADATALEEIGVRILRGDALDRASVKSALSVLPPDSDIVSTISGHSDGQWADSTGNINIVDEAANRKIRRFLLITSIGCGDMAPYASERARKAFGHVVDEKTKAEDHLKLSGIGHTILRPGGLLNDPVTGNGILVREPAIHGMINREDLALLALQSLASDRAVNQTFACVDKTNCRCDTPFTPFTL